MAIEAYVLDWLNLVLRWAHLITGIAWIGSSFYFMWLEARLNVPPRDPESPDVAGDLWAVHGGGFYHAQKYTLAPGELPQPLHWFKWEAYFTWLTGFLLLTVVYYANAGTRLVDPAVAGIGSRTAIVLSLALLPAGWLLYDALCRFGPRGGAFAALASALVLALCFGASQLFGGRRRATFTPTVTRSMKPMARLSISQMQMTVAHTRMKSIHGALWAYTYPGGAGWESTT